MASASPLLALLVLLLGSAACSIVHGAGAQRYKVVAPSSLKPSEICSGHKVTPPSKNGATLPLSHRHGPCSPVISKEKPSHEETLRRDQLRAAYIQTKVSSRNNVGKELQQSAVTIPTSSGFSLGTPEYVITVSLGTPAVTQVMSIDTGSDVSWVQCADSCAAAQSCSSSQKDDKLFDPAKSATYSAFSCGAAQCAQLGVGGNGCLNSQCQYVVSYVDGSNTTGTYGSDTLSLTSSDAVKSFQFGCSRRADGFVGQLDGLMGLGGDTESLVSQTAATYGKAFSYCLPPPSSSAGGFLTLGAAAGGGGASSGYSRTPMVRFNVPTFYGVFLQAITVAGTKLDVPASVFSAPSVVDSGTVITQLPPTAYQALRAAFKKEMKAYPPAAPVGILDTCFDFSGFSTVTVPAVALTFSRGAVMDLDVSGILYAGCLAFTATAHDGDVGILGNVQQHTFEMLFDVGGSTLRFRPGAC